MPPAPDVPVVPPRLRSSRPCRPRHPPVIVAPPLWPGCFHRIAAAGWVPAVQAQPAIVAPVRQYTIPEQPLADAVRAFGRQADVQVVFRSDLVEGRRSSAVKGEYSQMQALQQLLRGSGVRAQRGMDGTGACGPQRRRVRAKGCG